MNGPGAMMNGPGGAVGSSGPGAMMMNQNPQMYQNYGKYQSAPNYQTSGAVGDPLGYGGKAPGMGMNGPGAMMGPGGFSSSGPGPQMNPGMMGGMPQQQPQVMGDNLPIGPDCETCKQPIIGQVTQALGKTFHPDHFVCEYCSQPFPGGRFLVGPDENLYCEQDFMELHAKRCQVCNDIIRGKIVNAQGGLTFHSEHFICVGCGTNLVGKRYKIEPKTKHVYCPSCMEKEIRIIRPEAHQCAMCNRPIIGAYLLIKGQYIHPRHFRCEECGIEFKGGDCHEFENDYYCTPHYEILLLKKCAKCGKPCKGRSITALGKVWHPDHFSCHICSEPFVESQFFENDGLPYCQTHYIQLFGDNCAYCKEPIAEGGRKFLDKAYHPEHFKCSSCSKLLKDGQFTSWDSKPICKKCYGKLPEELRKKVEKRLKMEKKAKLQRMKAAQKGRRK
eukprot:TRINITY_DN7100_c0_g1_i1.p1 TRINITY_DN7100_c0_g1~~TRINITY_DN7100_c0_g1_i1.p1  ORF type:complete len:502 (-),score=67.39 TRINITY_DN7100_c0_g1_i1:243-1577(-)